MDDVSLLFKRFLNSATASQLRLGLVFVVSFLALINASGIPTIVQPVVTIFLACIMGLSLILMLYFAVFSSDKDTPSKENPHGLIESHRSAVPPKEHSPVSDPDDFQARSDYGEKTQS